MRKNSYTKKASKLILPFLFPFFYAHFLSAQNGPTALSMTYNAAGERILRRIQTSVQLNSMQAHDSLATLPVHDSHNKLLGAQTPDLVSTTVPELSVSPNPTSGII